MVGMRAGDREFVKSQDDGSEIEFSSGIVDIVGCTAEAATPSAGGNGPSGSVQSRGE